MSLNGTKINFITWGSGVNYPRSLDDGGIRLSGNIMALLDYEDLSDEIPTSNCFERLFSRFSKAYTTSKFAEPGSGGNALSYTGSGAIPVIEVAEGFLPATKLKPYCYSQMFYYLFMLKRVPANLLPATELAEGCYSNMFYSCLHLASLPSLPATVLAKNCYASMFSSVMDSVTAIPFIRLSALPVEYDADGNEVTVTPFYRMFYSDLDRCYVGGRKISFHIGAEPTETCSNACSDIWRGDTLQLGGDAFVAEDGSYFSEIHDGERIWTNVEVLM